MLNRTSPPLDVADEEIFGDDRLRLIFTCCHPALSEEAQIALTLREVCGLSTQAVARAFLTSEETMAQRLVRAKKKIRDAGIPYETPDPSVLEQRIEGVLAVVYGVFTEGYAATVGTQLIDVELCEEAIRLGRLLDTLLPDHAGVMGLLALMLLHDARRASRTSDSGDVVLLDEPGPIAVGPRRNFRGPVAGRQVAVDSRTGEFVRRPSGDCSVACEGGGAAARPIGRRLSACMKCCFGCSLRRSSN